MSFLITIPYVAGLLKPLVILYCATGGADFYEYTERTMVRQHTAERIPAGAERGTAGTDQTVALARRYPRHDADRGTKGGTG